MHIINAEQFTAADIDLSTESELTLREAPDAVLSNVLRKNHQTATTWPRNSVNLLMFKHPWYHEASMSRTDISHITEILWSLIQ